MNSKKFIIAVFAVFLSAAACLQAAPDTVLLQAADADGNSANGMQLHAGRTLHDGATFYFTPGSPVQPGGQVVVKLPSGWSMPHTDTNMYGTWGYVNLVSTYTAGGAQLTLYTTDYAILVAVSGAPFAGEDMKIVYNQPWIQWNTQNNLVLPVLAKHTATDPFVKINELVSGLPPAVDIVAGPPANVTFDTWGMAVQKDVASKSPVKVRLVDNAWITTKTTSAIQVDLSGMTVVHDTGTFLNNYAADPTAEFSLSADPWSPISQLSIVSGTSGAEFYYKTSATANNTIIRLTNTLSGFPNANDMWVNVISEGISNARIHKGDYSGNSSITLQPNENAYIDFSLGSSNMSWQVLISSSPDRTTPLWTYWGWGTPMPGQVTWGGSMSYFDPVMNYWRNERAPKGTYYVRIQFSNGGIYDDSLSITLQSLEIAGYVRDAQGDPVSGVGVYCYGPSYAYTATDSAGRYVLSGLTAGSYNLGFQKSGYSYVWINNVNAGETKDVVVKQPVYVRINAHRSISTDTANAECWGNVNLMPIDGTSMPYGASLHFAVNVSTSDNGMWTHDSTIKRYEIDNSTGMQWEAGKWTTLEVVPGSYTLRADMFGYDAVERQLYVSTGAFIDTIVFSPRPVVIGNIQLASPAENGGAWVSIDAVPYGYQHGTNGCGTSIPMGMSSGTYALNGLSAGRYTLRAFAPGYRKASAVITINPGDMAVFAPLLTLNASGGMNGTLTIEGDTNDPALSGALGSGSSFMVNLNAWSPDSYAYGWTQVTVNKSATSMTVPFTIRGLDDGTYWINSWLQGFELQNTVGWYGVRALVANGTGSVNITFKRHSARIQCTFKVPNDDYDNLKIGVSGMNINADSVSMVSISSGGPAAFGITFDTHTGIMTTPPLATGFYQIKGEYAGTGLARTKSAMTVSGQTSRLDIDLTAQTHAVAGKVSISPSNPPQGFTDIAVLVDSAPANNTVWDGALGISTTSFRVQAIDYSKMMKQSGPSSAVDFSAKSGIINGNGSFVINGLVPGAYLLKIPALELDGNTNNGKETAFTEKVVYVNGDTGDIGLEVSKGYSIRGQVKLPSGETATRNFEISVYKPVGHDKQYVGYARVALDNASSGDYEVKGLASGNYVLTVNDWGYQDNTTGMWMPRQYASSSVNVEVGSADLNGQNIQLGKGGKIVFKLRDVDSGTTITPANKDQVLPTSFRIRGEAHPWVEGGWIEVNIGNMVASGQDAFEIPFLPEALYDLSFGKSDGAAMSGGSSSGNQATYASKIMSAIKVRNGQATDIGIVDMRQGLTIAGTVSDKNGNPLPNIPVVAIPSLSNEWTATLYGFTDANGKYSIAGLSPEYPYYDFIACPRAGSQFMRDMFFFYGAGGITYGEKTRTMVKVKDGPTVGFVLEDAKGSVRGTVVTEDGGKLQSMEDPNIPQAMVLMQLENTVPRSNPVGDIETMTEYDGSFLLEALSPGTYHLTVMSGGYLSASRTVTVGNDAVDIGTLTLRRGAKVSGSITGVDGKNPSASDIEVVVAANDDFSEIVLGMLKKSGETTVTGYELAGFQPGTAYHIMFFGKDGNDAIPALSNYSVPFSTYVKTDLNLVYKIAEPSIFSRVTRDGNRYTIYFELSGALRKSLPSDELDALVNSSQKIVTVTSGNQGHLGYPYMSPDRKKIVCVYTAGTDETSFTLRLHAFTKAVNPATGTEFEVDEQFQYYAGIAAKNRAKVSNLKGGRITLEGDPSNIQFSPGTFELSGSTSSLYVDFTRADSVDELRAAGGVLSRGVPALRIPRAPQAYPNRLYTAMQAAQSAGVSAFSAFYDVMLPQGVSRVLKKDATLSLSYAGNVDPSTLNLYYYDETNRVYLLENRNRSVDSESQTLSVHVNHASVFVILQANASVIQGTTYGGPLFVFNFPNPFNLVAKTVGLTHPTMNRSISGTMLHYGLPGSVSGEVEIRIYNVAGELVRTINDGVRTGGYHYYTEWDGTNDNGKKVASGAYVCRFTVDGKNEKFFKMAVIK